MARAPDSRRKGASAEAPALPPSMRDRVPFLLYRSAETSHSLANAMLAEIVLNARQAGILTMVTEVGPMTQKALGDALRIDRTTMVALLDDLEEKDTWPDSAILTTGGRSSFSRPTRVLAGLLRRLHEGLASGPA